MVVVIVPVALHCQRFVDSLAVGVEGSGCGAAVVCDFQDDVVVIVDIAGCCGFGDAVYDGDVLFFDPSPQGVVLECGSPLFRVPFALFDPAQPVVIVPGEQPAFVRGVVDDALCLVALVVVNVGQYPAGYHLVSVVVLVAGVFGAWTSEPVAYVVVAVFFRSFWGDGLGQAVDVVVAVAFVDRSGFGCAVA